MFDVPPHRFDLQLEIRHRLAVSFLQGVLLQTAGLPLAFQRGTEGLLNGTCAGELRDVLVVACPAELLDHAQQMFLLSKECGLGTHNNLVVILLLLVELTLQARRELLVRRGPFPAQLQLQLELGLGELVFAAIAHKEVFDGRLHFGGVFLFHLDDRLGMACFGVSKGFLCSVKTLLPLVERGHFRLSVHEFQTLDLIFITLPLKLHGD
mmetsp:Transcript_3717/g.7532  ORF Transcript_3717/g.7532 Transcript_3717/m.7532 type:complete len:209 (-) Transcript_3717:137-763(-)